MFYVTQLSEAPPPSASEVRAGVSSGGGQPLAAGALVVSKAGVDEEGAVDELTRDTRYSTYFVAEDTTEPRPNMQGTVSSVRLDLLR